MLLRKLSAFFIDIIEVIVFSVAIFLFIYLLVLQPHKIKGASMEPNFPNGEYLLTDKVTYRFREPKRGDVIVFKAPQTNDEEFIKRIIGLPSEKIEISEGLVFINDRVLNELYISPEVNVSGGSFLPEGQEVVIPTDQFFVLGDNRPYSSDSRAWGLVPKENITGRGWLIYWPIPNAGVIPAVEYNFN